MLVLEYVVNGDAVVAELVLRHPILDRGIVIIGSLQLDGLLGANRPLLLELVPNGLGLATLVHELLHLLLPELFMHFPESLSILLILLVG